MNTETKVYIERNSMLSLEVVRIFKVLGEHNARLRGWQRIALNLNTPTVTTTAHWDWKRHALTVPLEAFVNCSLLSGQNLSLWLAR